MPVTSPEQRKTEFAIHDTRYAHRVLRIAHRSPYTPTGFLVVLATVITTVLLLLGLYFLSFAQTEQRLSAAQRASTLAYYLAEAGAQQAIWKLGHDDVWRQGFLSNPTWSASLESPAELLPGGSYNATVRNSALAQATVTAIASLQLGDGTAAQRVVKLDVTRATGSSEVWTQNATGAGQDEDEPAKVEIQRDVTFNGGILQSNKDIKLTSGATVTVNNGSAIAVDDIETTGGAILILNGSTQTEGAAPVAQPQVDFDSDEPTSYRNRATQVYSSSAFEHLPDGTVLTGITYVTGKAEWREKSLTVNGLLLSTEKMTIELEDRSTVTVNVGVSGSGLLSKDKMEITMEDSSALMVNGVIYASDKLTITAKDDANLTVNGAIISRQVKFKGESSAPITITYQSEYASQPLDPDYNLTAPVVQVNHWEEQY